MEKERFTVGELAELAGVSPRTIRYYDKKGLLSPVGYSENQYRQYDKSSLLQLQQVLMLKYIGFSLEEIMQIFQPRKEMSITDLLAEQKRMLLQKREQLNQVIAVVEKTQEYCSNDELRLPQLSELVKMLIDNKNAGQLWGYYEKYGSKQQDWYPWLFRQLQLKESEHVLDIGGGYGLVWRCSFQQIPQGVQIVVLDKARDELNALKGYVHENRHLLKKGSSFSFENVDVKKLLNADRKVKRDYREKTENVIQEEVETGYLALKSENINQALTLMGQLFVYSTVAFCIGRETMTAGQFISCAAYFST